jgi:hypothetical protein
MGVHHDAAAIRVDAIVADTFFYFVYEISEILTTPPTLMSHTPIVEIPISFEKRAMGRSSYRKQWCLRYNLQPFSPNTPRPKNPIEAGLHV